MAEPRWLDDTQAEAWQGLLAIFQRALPEIERTLKAHQTLGVHYHILVQLSAAPDRTLRLAELANLANVSPSRLTHRLRLLVERGDIKIAEDATDKRAKNATLTKKGQKRLDELAPIHIEDVQRLIFDPLNRSETAALARATSQIAAALCEHPEYLNPQT